MIAHHAPATRRPGLNSFAQWPEQRDATPDSADTPQAAGPPQTAETPQAAETVQAEVAPQAEIAPSRPVDRIADRFPAIRDFMAAQRAGTGRATHDAAEGPVVTAADTASATRGTGTGGASAAGTDMRMIVALLLALSTLPTVLFFMEVDRQATRGPRARAALDV